MPPRPARTAPPTCAARPPEAWLDAVALALGWVGVPVLEEPAEVPDDDALWL